MELQKRKPNRLKHYDYSQNGAYFITICTDNKKPILSHITVGTSNLKDMLASLSDHLFGKNPIMTILFETNTTILSNGSILTTIRQNGQMMNYI